MPSALGCKRKSFAADIFYTIAIKIDSKKHISAKTFLTQCNIKKKHQDTANLLLVRCKRKSFVAVMIPIEIHRPALLTSAFDIVSYKGGLILESFSYGLQSPKKCVKNYSEHLLFRWIDLRIVFGTVFEIGASV